MGESEEVIAGRISKIVNLPNGRARCFFTTKDFEEVVAVYDRSAIPLEFDDLLSFRPKKKEAYKRVETQYLLTECDYEVEMPRSESAIQRAIQRALSATEEHAKELYMNCENEANKHGISVCDWLDEVSERVPKRKRKTEIMKLHTWWITHRIKRRLLFLKISESIVDELLEYYNISYYECYCRITTNPLDLLPLPIPIVQSIVERFELDLSADDLKIGEISRLVYNRIYRNGDSCIPRKLINYEQNIIDSAIERFELREKFGMIFDSKTYEATELIANDIAGRLSKPLDRHIEPKFTSEKITPIQREAVKMACNNRLSIITGPGGSGKCLDPDTLVIRFDGTKVKVKDLHVGDRLMGPDSTSRTVLSLAQGIDMMYRITPEHGESFVCNAPHLLTLVSPHAVVIGNMVEYYQKGKAVITTFSDPISASRFVETLKDDLFDLPLIDYLKLDEFIRIKYRLIHVPIDYPEKKKLLSFNIHEIGRRIKDLGYIPSDFLYSTVWNRQRLLDGIIDVLGIDDSEVITIVDSDECLLESIKQLALSLGRFSERLNDALLIYENKKYLKQAFSVTALGLGPYAGFELTGDGRFLLNDFKVTHNTTIIKEIVYNLKKEGISYLLASFTGKAVARMKEVTRDDRALTLHMTLGRINKEEDDVHEFDVGGKEEVYEFIQSNNLEFDHLIIDEGSMVPTGLMARLAKSRTFSCMTLIGDKNQLQPVGWGSYFKETLKFGRIPTIRLDKNHRSKEVIYRMVDNRFVEGEKFRMIPGSIATVSELYERLIKGGRDSSQIMVITSHTELVAEINKKCQYIVKVGHAVVEGGPPNPKAKFVGRGFHLRDKVMMMKNNYTVGQMNGDIGKITEIGDKTLTVRFQGGKLVDFYIPTQKELDSKMYTKIRKLNTTLLDLAFCTTVHKSQGSESPVTIIYIKSGLNPDRVADSRMFNQCWLYTALSRAQEEIYCVGDVEALNWMAAKGPPERFDCLSEWIAEYLPLST